MNNLKENNLIDTYDVILKANLANDNYEVINNNVVSGKFIINPTGKLSVLADEYTSDGCFYSEDILTFKENTSLSFLKDVFEQVGSHFISFRRKFDNKYYWCELLMARSDEYSTDNQLVYFLFKKRNEVPKHNFDETYYLKSKKVLIFDDNPEDAQMLAEIIEETSEVLKATTTEKAYECLRLYSDDIFAIIGHLETKESIFEHIRLFRRNKRYDVIPIIIATDDYSSEFVVECLENGAFDVIFKPFNSKLIINKINNLCKLKYSLSTINAIKIDPLTGLYSKHFFFKKTEEILDLNPDKNYRIICSDIENFRMVNENHGTESGDKTLVYIAEHISEVLPDIVIGGRISGDVFAFLREDTPFEYHSDLWKKLRMNAPVPNLVIKYGAVNADRETDVKTLCDHAIEAAKSIKNMYDKPFAEYTEELKERKIREKMIIDHMDDAIDKKQFEVYYQPKLDIQENKLGGAEALIRWHHPMFGFLNPMEFIPLFETNGFIYRLDMYVLETVCRNIKEWNENNYSPVPVSINLSRRDFENANLLSEINNIVEKYGVNPKFIHFEVTESAFSDSIGKMAEIIKSLKNKGFIIELDDFGSGYSSLTVLNEIPADVLKIDKSILFEDDNKDNKILQFCIELARILNLTTVIEGVETKCQLEELKNMGCDEIQGYYYSKPIPKDKFEEFIKK